MRDSNRWSDQPVTILGLSKSGSAVAKYIQKRGGRCFLSEVLPASPANEALRKELEAMGAEVETGGHSSKVYSHSNMVVVSPGIPPSSTVIRELKMSGKQVISEVELAYLENRETRKAAIIGITGTNGKTTTTTLISEILTHAGQKPPACGNIGYPMITALDEAQPDTLVVELSSYQLEFSPTFTANIAVFMNFTPDHLDWHGSLDAYRQAKLRLYTGPQSPQWSVALADDPFTDLIVANTHGKVLAFSRDTEKVRQYEHKAYLDGDGHVVIEAQGRPAQKLFSVSELKLIGAHNHENVLAAAAAAWLAGIAADTITEACLAFGGVEHRLEPVATLDGVTYYNDSKATNPDASISALRAFDQQKVILIAGGRDKMTPLEPFVDEIKRHAEHVVLIGEAAQRFAGALADGGFRAVSFANDLNEAIRMAGALSKGQPVLFSPACASFDMFKNFELRGKAFKEGVAALNRKEAALN